MHDHAVMTDCEESLGARNPALSTETTLMIAMKPMIAMKLMIAMKRTVRKMSKMTATTAVGRTATTTKPPPSSVFVDRSRSTMAACEGRPRECEALLEELQAALLEADRDGDAPVRLLALLSKLEPSRKTVVVESGDRRQRVALEAAPRDALAAAAKDAVDLTVRRMQRLDSNAFAVVERSLRDLTTTAAVLSEVIDVRCDGRVTAPPVLAPRVHRVTLPLDSSWFRHTSTDEASIGSSAATSSSSSMAPASLPAPLLVPPDSESTRAAYRIDGHDGVVLLPGLLSVSEQLAWARRALRRYIEPPNRRTIDADGSGARAVLREAWPKYVRASDEALLRRITWATLGMDYDWQARVYPSEPGRPMPREVVEWASAVSRLVGAPMRAEAGIVNFYHCVGRKVPNTMGGHRDDAEPYRDAPVLSLSVGCAAVFLLGGDSRAVAPTPILLRSGDVLVMGGASRLALHGVARVLPDTCPAFESSSSSTPDGPAEADDGGAPGDTREEEAFRAFLSAARININLRQVWA